MVTVISRDHLAALYDRHAAGLYHYAKAILREQEAAKDVLQEVFVKLAGSGLPEVANEKAWLYRLAHNAAIDQLRRAATRKRHRETIRKGPPLQIEPEHKDGEGIALLLEQALASLPPEQASVARLHLWQDLTFDQIAKVQDIPLNTAASRYRYAIAKLRELLKPLYEEWK